jgi:hypothetical protein
MPRKTTDKKENTVSTETTEPDFADVDVDAPIAAPEPTAEDTVTAPTSGETAPTEKPAKKESTRPPVPEGKVSPVAFAKLLSEHLTAKAKEKDANAADVNVAPQVVYSYIKNNGPESKNPFPAEKAEGRAAVVDPQAGLDWWDAKDARVAAQKSAAADKAAKKAAGKTETPATTETTPVAEVVEAE